MADNVPIKRTYKSHEYTYNNSGTGLSESKPIDPYVPEEELLSEDYIQHVLTSDLVSLDAARGKIPISDPTTGRLRMSWIADQMATTTLPVTSETEATDPNNNDSVMTPKATYIAINNVVKDATTTRKGIVQLTDSLTPSVLNRSDLAITPLALKNYLAASGGFSHAGYNDAFGITAYASDTDVNGILSYSKTNTNATLRATDLYSDYSITPYTLYNYVSNNDLTLNTGKNIVFSSRAINGSTTAPTDVGKISVDRTNKTMTVMVNDKNITIANTGNVTLPGEITATKFNGPATKLTTTSAGSSSKYVYFSNGIPVVSTSNIGSATQPVYVVNGELKPATSVSSIKVNSATAADKLNVSNTGTATKLTYFSNGVPVASASNVGDANTPVYLNAGSITSTGKSFANYLPLAGGTITGPIKKATTSNTWVAGAKESAALNLTNTAGFNSAISMYTKSNKIGFATYPGNDDLVYLYSVTKDNATANTNTVLKQLKWNSANGTLSADTFSGPLSGNATSANKVNKTLQVKTTSSAYSSFNGSADVKIDKVYASATADSAGTITSTLPISKGGTGATTRLAAAKALTNENVGTSATYFVTLTDSWGKFGYSSLANAKSALGLKSAAYTESNAYLAANGKAASATTSDTSTKLKTARTITVKLTLNGNTLTASGSFDGSGNLTLNLGSLTREQLVYSGGSSGCGGCSCSGESSSGCGGCSCSGEGSCCDGCSCSGEGPDY